MLDLELVQVFLYFCHRHNLLYKTQQASFDDMSVVPNTGVQDDGGDVMSLITVLEDAILYFYSYSQSAPVSLGETVARKSDLMPIEPSESSSHSSLRSSNHGTIAQRTRSRKYSFPTLHEQEINCL